MKGKNVLWGTVLYLAIITLTYGRRDATISESQSKAFETMRKSLGDNKSAIAAHRQRQIMKVDKPDEAFAKAYQEKTWIR